ncbi:hypothetical protein DPMN_145158 [Dreissena polymorpha]|uniref:Uncharacterized protein n=1 Tax=Dreissena polymorpha TaxID=45954 RepID=A0A9D4F5H2_DREPO|nr:hypothetical protein DPMN_145158 [Dreissena polymorpha]
MFYCPADTISSLHILSSAGTLTSRRLPIWLNYVLRDILPAPFGRTRCTLTSPTKCTLTSPFYATFCLAPFGRTRCTLTSPYYATFCLAPFGRTRCTLTSPYNATFCLALFGRTRCTLTSRRLPIGLNYVLRDIVLVSGHAPFGRTRVIPRKRPSACDQPSTAYLSELDRTYYATFCLAPFGRTRCTLTSPYNATFCLALFGRTRCTLTSRRLPIGLNYVLRDIVLVSGHAPFGRTRVIPRKRPSACDQPSTAYLSELVSAGTLIRIGRITRHFACEWACPFMGTFRTNKSYPPEATQCKLTSRRLPIGLNYVLRDILPCTLTSPYDATFCMAPFGRTRCTLTSPYYATFCLAPFGRTRCTLTSPFYATFCLAPFGRTRCTLTSLSAGTITQDRSQCTLTSRRLPIGLN